MAIVLGSGLGDFAGTLEDAVSMPYGELPHWPASKVIGHEGRLVIGRVGGRTIAALSGRCHVYEGHDLKTVTFAVRALGLLGVKMLVLTNAAGGINTGFSSGALMVIDDHINLIGNNPLVGPNDDRFGVRFPDMTEVYSTRLRAVADAGAKAMGLDLPHGVYVALLGPSYRRRPRSVSCAPLAPTRSACRQCPKPLPRGTWAWRCSASRASRTWRPVSCRSRCVTTK
ncbi:MAG: purine-nucleoside phosphorylase [Vicinamibacterales bacterium]